MCESRTQQINNCKTLHCWHVGAWEGITRFFWRSTWKACIYGVNWLGRNLLYGVTEIPNHQNPPILCLLKFAIWWYCISGSHIALILATAENVNHCFCHIVLILAANVTSCYNYLYQPHPPPVSPSTVISTLASGRWKTLPDNRPAQLSSCQKLHRNQIKTKSETMCWVRMVRFFVIHHMLFEFANCSNPTKCRGKDPMAISLPIRGYSVHRVNFITNSKGSWAIFGLADIKGVTRWNSALLTVTYQM